MNRHIQNIVFDLGGVLIDWDPKNLYRSHFNNEKKMDHFLSTICTMDWNLQQDKGRSLEEATMSLIEKYPDYKKEIGMYYSEWPKMLNGIIEENVALIDSLKKNHRIFALTNWSKETFPIAIQRFDFLKKFEGILVSGEEKLVKPDPEIYSLFLKRFDLKAEECVFIDDNLSNIVGARKMGFECIHYKSDTKLKNEFKALGISLK